MVLHTKFQSESTLTTIVEGFQQRFHARGQEAFEAQSELDYRRKMGGEKCSCCRGVGWFKERGPFSNDEICEDCDGTGTMYKFKGGQ